ncbi:MAG: hypothetical protein LBG79_00795 [Spirochaetaceae bacterium]|jgi:hypothetical protein|nr:hypothetical protein [Spirochaetaceae bacterium]
MLDTDLQAILLDYAERNGTAFIDRDILFKELSSHALYKAQKDRSWEVWTKRPREKFETDLKMLIASEICSIQKEGGHENIYFPQFFVERIRTAWKDIEKQEKNIFPNDKTIRFNPSADVILATNEKEFVNLLRETPEDDIPIIKYSFSNSLGATYLLASFLESRLLDASIAKLRMFLINKDNRGFCLTRIRSVFPDRFMQANTIMDLIVKNPIGCITFMRNGDEDAFIMWIKLCEFINEMCGSDKTPPTESDIAVRQSTEFIKAYNSYYRELAAQKNEKEYMLNDLYSKLSDPPFFWKFTDIYKIPLKSGRPAIESIKHEIISEYILKRTYDSGETNFLPPLIVFYDEFKEKYFIKKEVVFAAFNELVHSSRQEIRAYITKRWYKLIKNYSPEPAIKNDSSFEIMLNAVIKKIKPFVVILYQDVKLRLLQKEFAAAPDSEYNKIFNGGELKTLSELYNLDRRGILKDVMLSLPFWYSVPILSFFCRIFSKKNPRKIQDDD